MKSDSENTDLRKALEKLLNAIEKDPGNVELLDAAGDIYMKLGQNKLSVEFYKKAADIVKKELGISSKKSAYDKDNRLKRKKCRLCR